MEKGGYREGKVQRGEDTDMKVTAMVRVRHTASFGDVPVTGLVC